MAIFIAQVQDEKILSQHFYSSERAAGKKAVELQDEWKKKGPGGPDVFVIGPIGNGMELKDAFYSALMDDSLYEDDEAVAVTEEPEQIEEGFDKFMRGVVDGEAKNRAKKTLNEDSPGRTYIKRYGELPQNRIVFKKK